MATPNSPALLAAKVQREGLEEARRKVRPAAADLVEDGDGAGQARQAASLGRLEAEQSHDVRGIAVVADCSAGLVLACSSRVRSDVTDVPDQPIVVVLGPWHTAQF